MALKLMYITNRPEIAQNAETAGVDRIFVDLEYIGKAERQGGMDTVQSRHTLDDVKRISEAITTAELLVRVNPIHDALDNYPSSKDEIDATIEAGADILMLPFFHFFQGLFHLLIVYLPKMVLTGRQRDLYHILPGQPAPEKPPAPPGYLPGR